MNLVGVVSARLFDECQPRGRRSRERLRDCDTILLLGAGGSSFWEKMARSLGPGFVPRPRPGYHPINAHSERIAEDVSSLLRDAGHPCRPVYPDDTPSLNFLQMAEMAGFGTVSPVIGLLLHPEYGPWVGLRAAVLARGEPFGPPELRPRPEPFEPCLTCSKPCVAACPVGVFDGHGGANFRACGDHRHKSGCSTGCEVRRACPVGAHNRFGPAEENFRHAYSYFALRREYGYGWRGMLPRAWR